MCIASSSPLDPGFWAGQGTYCGADIGLLLYVLPNSNEKTEWCFTKTQSQAAASIDIFGAEICGPYFNRFCIVLCKNLMK